MERVYGIPSEQVVGSSVGTSYEVRDGKPALVRLPAIDLVDDKGGKPVGINSHIGRSPVAAFGKSDGDAGPVDGALARRGTARHP